MGSIHSSRIHTHTRLYFRTQAVAQVNMEIEIFLGSYCLPSRASAQAPALVMIYDFRRALALCLHSVVAVTVHIPPFVMALY